MDGTGHDTQAGDYGTFFGFSKTFSSERRTQSWAETKVPADTVKGPT